MKLKQFMKRIYCKTFKSKILMFHHVQSHPQFDKSGCKLDTEKFYKIIMKQENIVSIMSLIKNSKLGTQKKTAITFDDGLADVYTIAYPFLKSHEIPFTVFILTDLLDTPGYITTEQLHELSSDNLVTIGAHGTKHKILPQCNEEELKDEIFGSKEKLEAIIRRKVDIFAYSHGQYNEDIKRLVEEAGYKFAFSVRSHPLNFIEKKKPYELPRYHVDNSTLTKYGCDFFA